VAQQKRPQVSTEIGSVLICLGAVVAMVFLVSGLGRLRGAPSLGQGKVLREFGRERPFPLQFVDINQKQRLRLSRLQSPQIVNKWRSMFPFGEGELISHAPHQCEIEKFRFRNGRKVSIDSAAGNTKSKVLVSRVSREQRRPQFICDRASGTVAKILPHSINLIMRPTSIKYRFNHRSHSWRCSNILNMESDRHIEVAIFKYERRDRFGSDLKPWAVSKFEFFGENVRLRSNGPQGLNRGVHAMQADYNQQAGEERGESGGPSSDEIYSFLALVVFLCFGGISLALWTLKLDKDRGVLRASLIALGLGGFGVGWLLYMAWLPFGLPQHWHWPARYPYYKPKPKSYFPHALTVSQKLLTPSGFSYYNNYMANVLSTDKQIGIIGALCEGSSIRSIERTTGVHRDTIMRLGVRVGQGCTALLDAKMRNLDCHRLEMDELWGFVGKKEKHLRPDDDSTLGNVWTFCVIDADTKVVPTFKVSGDRSQSAATAFVLDVADRMKNRVQISTDGLSAYVEAIDWAFGGNVDYGQIIKTYGTEESVEAQRRYSAPKISSIEKKSVFGRPDFDLISTSYVERLNATTRLHVKRLARLTHAFSKKRENFEAAVGLHFAYYNFVRRHNTLRCTPAMAAGVEQSFWSVGDLLEAVA
jgi:IS1 family transposase